MANHKSAKKRARSSEAKRERNKYQHKTVRNALKKVRKSEDAAEVATLTPTTIAMIDKLAKKNVIHKNKAANLKSKLMKKTAKAAAAPAPAKAAAPKKKAAAKKK